MSNNNNIKAPSTEEKRLQLLQNRKPGNLSRNDSLGLFAVGTFGLHVLTVFGLLLLYGNYSRLAQKPPPSLVQLSSGEALTVAPIGSKERTPEVVKRFTVDTLTLIMNWSGKLPSKTTEEAVQPTLDPGVDLRTVGGKGKVTTAAWQGSFALSEDFRKQFLQRLAELIPPGVFSGQTQAVLVPLEVQNPIKIDEGQWKVTMVANLMVFQASNNLGDVIPFNKEIFVRAVEAPKYVLSAENSLAAVVATVRASGLEIYAIRDLQPEKPQ
ncbi:MAG: hypothetical protein F6J89_08210 [Symploca sp. SIO1C4]|uniref:Uncharacterized protein n=1 Tax=Symploca sp. SIO1C4 TaxID=2607765 RepID=A0A6B3NC28_9CYAN|nr:hypothetical protein [Symploca sp. SIO1C4]